jgi:hypothetical protein
MSTTPKLDKMIEFYTDAQNDLLVETYREIRAHLQRIPDERPELSLSDVHKAVWELSGVPDLLRGKSVERYPSEIETRLIDLVENCIRCMPTAEWHKGQLAAIKRDLGVS